MPDIDEQEMAEAGQFVPPGRQHADAADLNHPVGGTQRFDPNRLREVAHGPRPRVHGDPRDTRQVLRPPVSLAGRIQQREQARRAQVAPGDAETPVATPEPPKPRETPREVQRRLLNEAPTSDQRPPRREEPPQRDSNPVRREERRAVDEGRADTPAMATSRSNNNGRTAGRPSRWNLPKITRQTNVKPTYVQTTDGLLADRTALGDQFPKFMVFVTILGMILSIGSTINAVQFVIGELARRHILGITLVADTHGVMDISTGWKYAAVFVGAICAAGIAWGQAQLSDQTTNNQSLAFWVLEFIDGAMTYAFIAPVVIGVLTIIHELNVQAFYTAAGAELAVVCAFLLNQAVRAKRMDEELDPFWFKLCLGIFFVLGNILSRMLLPAVGDGDTAEGIVKQIVAAAFGICAFISFLSAYVPEQTAFGSRLRKLGRKDTASGAA